MIANLGVELCACLGLASGGRADERAAEVDGCNHNLNTNYERYAAACSTHTFRDPAKTDEKARRTDLSSCSKPGIGIDDFHGKVVGALFAPRSLGGNSGSVEFLTSFDIASGRKMRLRPLPPAQHLTRPLLFGGYPTSKGQTTRVNLEIVADVGFHGLAVEPHRRKGSNRHRCRAAVRHWGTDADSAPDA